ncbi:hypothetical protein CR513_18561, partial [Mucuna pruriens]
GPSRITTISRKCWFLTFIDHHTRFTWIFLLNENFDVALMWQNGKTNTSLKLLGLQVPKQRSLRIFGEAILIATYLINRLPTRILNFQNSLVKIHYIVAFVHSHDPSVPNLTPKHTNAFLSTIPLTKEGINVELPSKDGLLDISNLCLHFPNMSLENYDVGNEIHEEEY